MMNAPPGLAPAAGARRDDLRREDTIGQPCLTVEGLVRMARQSPAVAALNIGQKHLGRVIRAFIAAEVHERDFIAWVIAYADPTGETAVRNVMRRSA